MPVSALATILIGSFLPAADAHVVNVALPTIDDTLHASPAQLQLVVAGYVAAFACLLVTGGRLGDNHGRRRVFVWGMGAFAVTSLVCGFAPNIETLIAGRVAQGVTAAMMVPQVLATVQATMTGEERQRALGVFGAMIGSATIVGQMLGGLVVSADIAGLTWRPIFLINVPVCVLGIISALRVVPETRAKAVTPVDRPGTGLLTATLVLALVPLTVGRDTGWPLWAWACVVLSVVTGCAFAVIERRRERDGAFPLLAPSLLRIRGVGSGLLTSVLFFVGVGGFLFITAVSLQSGLHFGPVESALVIAPYAAGYLTVSLVVRRFVARFGRQVIVVGAVLLALAYLAVALASFLDYPGLSHLSLVPIMFCVGGCQGLVMIPMYGTVLASVPPDQAGVVSGMLATTQQVGLALGVATLGTLFYAAAGTSPDVAGWGVATVVAFVAIAALALVAALAGRRLPDQQP